MCEKKHFKNKGCFISISREQKIAVFDWGGGTLDIAVVELNDGTVVELRNNADYNKFMNCQIIGYHYTNLTATNYRSLVYNYNTANCDYNEFHNNYMQYGACGIYKELLPFYNIVSSAQLLRIKVSGFII